MTARRALTIAVTTLATVVLVVAFLFLPLSLATGHPEHALVEVIVIAACLRYVSNVMRADRRERLSAEAALPPERRPVRREPRRPITFQVRETVTTFAIWFVIVIAFNSAVVGLGPIPNVGIAVFAAFMLATLTVTGRHMMFRLTGEEDERDQSI